MSSKSQITARISSRTSETETYERLLSSRPRSSAERVSEASKGLALCWLMAVGFVFVPILHFVLVPLAGLAGFIVFFRKLTLHEFISATEIECPHCKAKLLIKAQAFNWPLRETCTQCRTDLVLSKL